MKRSRYTPEQIEFLRTGYQSMNARDLAEAFSAEFGLERTESQVKSTLQNHRIRCGRAQKDRLINRVRIFTPEQVQFLRDNYGGRSVVEMTVFFNLIFNTCFTRQQIKTAVHNRKITSGRTGCFELGHRSWNKDTKGQGLTGANKASFKKCHKPKNHRPLGSERICSKDGYVLIKIKERNPHTGFPTRWKHKHVHMWEQEHGPVPDGMVVAFRDGDKTNIVPDNLILVSRAELLRLNKHGYKDMPEELKPSVLALSKLEVTTFEKEKNQTPEKPACCVPGGTGANGPTGT